MSRTTFTARLTALPCFQHVKWDPDRAELWSFARWMLGGFAVLGAIAAWRTGAVGAAPLVLWGLGVALAASTLVPSAGWASYLAVNLAGGLVGYGVSRIVLTAMFYLVFTPIGVALRLSRHDVLGLRRRRGATMWIAHKRRPMVESYYRQF